MSCGLQVTMREGRVRFAVIVKPRSSRSALLDVHDGALRVALRAAPVEGAANAELVALLAKTLGVARSSVAIFRGASGRRKLVDVVGIDPALLCARLAPLQPSSGRSG